MNIGNSEKKIRYTFIAGCSRSGTTAMADLLRAHPSIVMGKERYAFIYRDQRSFGPELFNKDRFCTDFRKDDSHHLMLHPYYANIRDTFDQCNVIGDKISSIAQDYEFLFTSFPSARIIYMVRNIFDVASSFNGRANQAAANPAFETWPASRRSPAAVQEWNLSNKNTVALLGEHDVLVMPLEIAFTEDSALQALFSFLDLSVTESVQANFEAKRIKSLQLDATRRSLLTSPEKLTIMDNADFDNYKTLLNFGLKNISIFI